MILPNDLSCVSARLRAASSDELKLAVESRHGGTAKFVHSVVIVEEEAGRVTWQGDVAVFGLKHSPVGSFRAYAWAQEGPDGALEMFAILHTPLILSPREAVISARRRGRSEEDGASAADVSTRITDLAAHRALRSSS